jgi:hypothetical protein
MYLHQRQLHSEKETTQERQLLRWVEQEVFQPLGTKNHLISSIPLRRRLKDYDGLSRTLEFGLPDLDVALYASGEIGSHQQHGRDCLAEETMHVNGAPGFQQRVRSHKIGDHGIVAGMKSVENVAIAL